MTDEPDEHEILLPGCFPFWLVALVMTALVAVLNGWERLKRWSKT